MPHVAARTASRDRDTGRYQSHRPEQTLLYQIVDEYYPAFGDCHEFCVHGIIGARHTGTPHEHNYQETNLS